MAGLFGSAIVALCMGAVGNVNDACTHAVDAGTRQTGIRQNVDMAEDKSVELINHQAMKAFGKQTMSVLVAGGYVYKVVKEKSLNFRLPTLGLCSSASNQVALDSYKLVLEWRW